jgi:hypothetical protein
MPDWPQLPREAARRAILEFSISRLQSRPIELTGKGLRHTLVSALHDRLMTPSASNHTGRTGEGAVN